jgi:5-methylcytosine-specific restriction protein B
MPKADAGKSGDSIYEEVLRAAITLSPMILYGPPGTGKTKYVYDLVDDLRNRNKLGKFSIVQFHRKFTYEDFIEGYAPDGSGFSKKDGVFLEFCKQPSDASKIDVFAIDEINRTDLATTLGEVLSALEDREERTLKTTHFQQDFQIPSNLLLLGTMNTADKSISHMDFAIRRRFNFIAIYPDHNLLENWLKNLHVNSEIFQISEYIRFFRRTNMRIRESSNLGSSMQLGQSMFVPKTGESSLTGKDFLRNFNEVILPQLEAYAGFGSGKIISEVFNFDIYEEFMRNQKVCLESFIGIIRESQSDQSLEND